VQRVFTRTGKKKKEAKYDGRASINRPPGIGGVFGGS
jgi:hypothetical protein